MTGVNRRLPHAPWMPVLTGALLVWVACVGCLEAGLAARGFHPTLVDSQALWLRQRARAASLGSRALILVGSSRMQSDVDLGELRRLTGLEPVQLAISADPGTPVLTGLAADPAIRGTVLVEVLDNVEASAQGRWRSTDYEDYYEAHEQSLSAWDFANSESFLEDQLRSRLRSYADGTRPLTALTQRLLNPEPRRTYVTLLADRERWLDFSRTDARKLYYERVDRVLDEGAGISPRLPLAEFETEAAARIARVQPASDGVYLQNAQSLAAMDAAISRRGGHVIFVAMPLSGDVRAIMERRYPRQSFWDRLAQLPGIDSFNFQDDQYMRTLVCPDGSHLDHADRAGFTAALVRATHLDRRPASMASTGE